VTDLGDGADNDTNGKDYGLDDVSRLLNTKAREGNDEEDDTSADGDDGDDADEMLDLNGDGRLLGLDTRGETSDATNDSVVADVDDDATAAALDHRRREEGNVLGLEGILIGHHGDARLRLTLTCQRGVVHLHSLRLHDAQICRDLHGPQRRSAPGTRDRRRLQSQLKNSDTKSNKTQW